MSEIHFYQSMSKWYFHQNVKIMLLNERWYHILLSFKYPKWFDIGGWYFLKGFKLRLKGIFELAFTGWACKWQFKEFRGKWLLISNISCSYLTNKVIIWRLNLTHLSDIQLKWWLIMISMSQNIRDSILPFNDSEVFSSKC